MKTSETIHKKNIMLLSSSQISAYIELTKPRILTMVLVTTAFGFFLGKSTGEAQTITLFFTLLGFGLSCGGVGALNHMWEWKIDAQMDRTKNRPIPQGVISPVQALVFGTSLFVGGVYLLFLQVNSLTALLVAIAGLLYVFIYTPLKQISWWNTFFGAIPGAIPPMAGWVAATGELTLEAWILFAILFTWQHPHFYAIAWIWKDDYAKAGFKMLPVVDASGKKTFEQVVFYTVLMFIVSLLPTFVGMTGYVYLTGAIISGYYFLRAAKRFYYSHSVEDARGVLKTSVLYLPVLLLLIILDVVFRGII